MLLDSQLRKKDDRQPSALDFVESVKVQRLRPHRQISVRMVLVVFWMLIVIKCALAHWAIVRWDMPVAAFWIWFPTFLFAALCTIVLLARDSLAGPPRI